MHPARPREGPRSSGSASSAVSAADTKDSWDLLEEEQRQEQRQEQEQKEDLKIRSRERAERDQDVRSIHSSEFGGIEEQEELSQSSSDQNVARLLGHMEQTDLTSEDTTPGCATSQRHPGSASDHHDAVIPQAQEERPSASSSSSAQPQPQSQLHPDPSPTPPPPSEATTRRMEEIRDQLVSLLTKHSAGREEPLQVMQGASTLESIDASQRSSRSGTSTPTQSGTTAGRYAPSDVFAGSATPFVGGRTTTQRGPSASHAAACEMCGETLRAAAVRWICLDCPGGKWNACDECFGLVVDENHPHHTFAKVLGAKHVWRPQQQAQAAVPTTEPHLSSNDYTDPRTVFHLGINCSACKGAIIGARYKCATPEEQCKGINLCENCEASPLAQHPRDHPLLKYRMPIDLCKEVDLLDRTALDGLIATLLQNEENRPFRFGQPVPTVAPFVEPERSTPTSAILAAPSRFTIAGREPVQQQASTSDKSAVRQEVPPRSVSHSTTTSLWQAQMVEDGETPWGTSLAPGSIFSKSWKVYIPQGSAAWMNGARIVRQGLPILSRAEDPTLRTFSNSTIYPASDLTITLWNLQAPTLPGTYEECWRLVDDRYPAQPYGDPLIIRIRVQPHAQTGLQAQETTQRVTASQMTAAVQVREPAQGGRSRSSTSSSNAKPMHAPAHGLAPLQAVTLQSTTSWGPADAYTDEWRPRHVPHGATVEHAWQIRNSSIRSWPLINPNGSSGNFRAAARVAAIPPGNPKAAPLDRRLCLLRKSTHGLLCCDTQNASFVVPQVTLSPGEETCITIRGLVLPSIPSTDACDTMLVKESWQLVTSDGLQIGETLVMQCTIERRDADAQLKRKAKAGQKDRWEVELEDVRLRPLPQYLS